MADAAFITYLSGLCSRQFTATHYALLSSLALISVHTLGGASGVLATQVGWVWFYALCMRGMRNGTNPFTFDRTACTLVNEPNGTA